MSNATDRNELFSDLFVLELANNHWGSVARGKEIIRQHGRVVQETGVKAAIKFQFRDVDTFVHNAFKITDEVKKEGEVVQAPGSSSRYIKKTIATKLTPDEFKVLLSEVRAYGMLTMATPFDEKSVQWCADLDIDIVKIASQDAKSWVLVERIVALGKPTIISNGGTDIADLDRVVKLFEDKNVPLAINHCVSMYPSEDSELELNQVDYLKKRYPGHVIGYSTHEYRDWHSSVQITYAKGARTWERHIDIEDAEGTPVSKYCSLPHQVREWFIAFKKAQEMSGGDAAVFRTISEKEKDYVQSVSRGAYALRHLKKGELISKDNVGNAFEFVIPLQGAQLSSRDLDEPLVVTKDITQGSPITFDLVSHTPSGLEKSLTWSEMRSAITNSLLRTAWVGGLVFLAVEAGFFSASLWTLISIGLISVCAGFVMTKYHNYAFLPNFHSIFGAFANGLLQSILVLAFFAVLYLGAPVYVPFLMFAVVMVANALLSKPRLLFQFKTAVPYGIALALVGLSLAALGRYTDSMQEPWFLIVIASSLGLPFLEQISIRTFKTNVILPWLHMFWGGLAALLFAVVITVFSTSLIEGVVKALQTPMLVGLLAIGVGMLSVLSHWSRIKMRKAPGQLAHKRMAGVVTILFIAGLLFNELLFLFIISCLLLTSLIFGDKHLS